MQRFGVPGKSLIPFARLDLPKSATVNTSMLVPPRPDGAEVELRLGANIVALPEFDALPNALEGPVLLTVGDDVSTDDIMLAGWRILALRSNVPEIAKFTFTYVDEPLNERAMAFEEDRLDRRGRAQLRSVPQPGTRRARPALSRPLSCAGRELRAHPCSESRELRDRSTRVREPRNALASNGEQAVHHAPPAERP
jgi:hypothetical protein